MTSIRLFIPLFFICGHVCAQDDRSVSVSLFLIGDCGEQTVEGEPILNVLRRQVEDRADKSTVVFLGDNIYDRGLPEKGHATRGRSERILSMQADVVRNINAGAIFVPGNHDWAHWGKDGWQYVLNQQQWVDSLNNDRITLQPRNGCPGPVVVNLDPTWMLVVIDTQWLLHRYDKPGRDSGCSSKTSEEVFANLQRIFDENPQRKIIVAAHHPMLTYGIHGGVLTLRSHLFPLTDISHNLYIPLPVLGSLYAFYRKWIGSIQDTPHPKYRAMKKSLMQILSSHPGHVFVAGHEHALQHIIKDGTHYLVSGSGAKTENVKQKGFAKFAKDVRGFIRFDIMNNGEATARFFQVDEKHPEGKEIYSTGL